MATRIIPGIPTKRKFADLDLIAVVDANSDGSAISGSVPVYDGTELVWSTQLFYVGSALVGSAVVT